MSSSEFRGFIAWSIISVVLYPIFQYIFLYSSVLTTIAPQFVYSFEIFVLGCLSQYSNFRFRRFQKGVENPSIAFYATLNNYMSVGCLLDSVGLATINIASADEHPVAAFPLDVLSNIFNLGFVGTYAVLICIVYPPKETHKPSSRGSRTQAVEMQSLQSTSDSPGTRRSVSHTRSPSYTRRSLVVARTQQVQNPSDAGQVQNPSDAGQGQKPSDAGQVQNISDADQVQNISDADQVQDTSDAGQVQNTSDAGQVQNISDADQVIISLSSIPSQSD